MRRLTFVFVSFLILALLAACASTQTSDDADVDDTSDDVAAADPSPTPDEPDPTATPETDSEPTAEPEPEPTSTSEAEPTSTPEAEPEFTPTPEANGNGEPTEHIVEIQDPHDFVPDDLVIALGDTVTFVNTGRINHTSTLDPEIARDPDNAVLPDGAEPWDSDDLEPGDEFSITLEVPGDYVYFCRPHEVLGQIGAITVLEEGESPTAQPDDTDSDDDDPDTDDEDEADDYL